MKLVMKLNFLLILLFTSLFAVSAIEKTSLRYSEVGEVEVEIEATEAEDIESSRKDFKIHFVDHVEFQYKLKAQLAVLRFPENYSVDHDFIVQSSINRIYYPQAPPLS